MAHTDEFYMQEAIKEAHRAAEKDDVPVGALIVHEGRVVARAHNQIELLKDPTAHAEMIAITQAAATLSSKWLSRCTLYVTIEPCSMCAGAIVLARLDRLVFGARDPKTGACGSVENVIGNARLNHRVTVTEGILAQPCGALLSDFFRAKRGRGLDGENNS